MTKGEIDRPIFDLWPGLRKRVPWVELGSYPTAVESLAPVLATIGCQRADAWVKRDDQTSPTYGGNKVRTLEALFGRALDAGASRIYATGAFGSNHAAATVLHAPRVGLVPGVILFPQPPNPDALENLEIVLSKCPAVRALAHWSLLPWGVWATRRAHSKRGEPVDIMVPGGATPEGALGYVSAALELGRQIERQELPRPKAVLVGVGSTCTAAGLMVGFHLAARLGVGFTDLTGSPAPPHVVAVRVTPWPVTSPIRIVRLAVQTARLLAHLSGDESLALPYRQLRLGLTVDRRFLGPGYGRPTRAGREAIDVYRVIPGLELDTIYSGKCAAALLTRLRAGEGGPFLLWSTKSTAPLPEVNRADLEWAPPIMRRWMAKARAVRPRHSRSAG